MIVAGLAMARAAAPFLLSRTGLLTMAAIGVFVFYEGLPLGPLRMIPYVGPALESVTDGRVDRARKAGAAQERIAWEEARRRLLLKQEEERRAAQAKIDAAERAYLESRKDLDQQILALDDAIATEAKTDVENPACPARDFISRSVRDRLAPLGR